MKDKTGRPLAGTGGDRHFHDLEKRTPLVQPDSVSFIYSGQWRTSSKSASFTLSNEMVVLVDASAVSINLILPSAESNTHKVYIIKKIDSTPNTVTIKGANLTEDIDGEDSIDLHYQYQYVSIVCDGSDWYIIGGLNVRLDELLTKQLELLERIRIESVKATLHLASQTDENIGDNDAD